MDIVWWILIIACFIVSFIGLVYPIVPSVVMIWIGVFLYYFFISSLSWWTWGSLLFLTGILFIADYIANMYFVKRYGGSPWGLRAAWIGLIVGCFVLPPFGIILVPFLLVFVTELIQGQLAKVSFKIALGTVFAFLSSTLSKAFIQLIMIIIFILDVWL
ncbi:DUF456 domain-containing protein [Alkalihalobacterium bogoriense]|uniref:DUF456 domain-containing protein n=1 Tax=Alkalihalobacterium bogoriense TaxID=246272 RepID=UPI000551BE82|nr:DUF456 family protein [Alkalihalobacterium bogoriense]